jgi:hypothetical protein
MLDKFSICFQHSEIDIPVVNLQYASFAVASSHNLCCCMRMVLSYIYCVGSEVLTAVIIFTVTSVKVNKSFGETC